MLIGLQVMMRRPDKIVIEEGHKAEAHVPDYDAKDGIDGDMWHKQYGTNVNFICLILRILGPLNILNRR